MEEKSVEIPKIQGPLREQDSIRALLELLEQQGMERCEAKHPPVMFPAIDVVRQPGSRGQIRC